MNGDYNVSYRPPIEDLFANFALNWSTLSPVLYLLFGTLTAFFFIGLVLKHFKND